MTDSFRNNITIAVTVYDRRQYIAQAIQSALDQTVPVKVIVVEDCGPDANLKDYVLSKFGDRVQYFRNPRRRGLFDNWNACIELCTTPFLSILHDDDLLEPNFISAMQELMLHVPDCGLYFGRSQTVDARGRKICDNHPRMNVPWRKVPLLDFAVGNVVMFPGQLFPVEAARAVGGFRRTSYYCGDFEMWAKLANRFGAAQTAATVASVRTHDEVGRGTTRVERSGKIHAFTFVQLKRVRAMLRAQGINTVMNRNELLRETQLSTKFVLKNAATFSPRMLRYNYGLFMGSKSPKFPYTFLQLAARFLGPSSLKWASKAYRSLFMR